MVIVRMNKIDVGTHGAAYFLTLGNIEVPEKQDVKIAISEVEAELLKPLFCRSKKSGKFEENEEWV